MLVKGAPEVQPDSIPSDIMINPETTRHLYFFTKISFNFLVLFPVIVIYLTCILNFKVAQYNEYLVTSIVSTLGIGGMVL